MKTRSTVVATLLATAALAAAPALVAVSAVPGSARPLAAGAALAQEAGPAAAPADGPVATRLVVRAVANDAKVIGSGVGGARITVKDADTGEVLAAGVQEGGTGDTDAIMGPRERDAAIYDREGTGAFVATLPLDAPTKVLVEAEGPLGTPHAAQQASATLLLLPGVDVAGEGLVLVLHGFTVELEGAAAGDGPLPVDALPVRVSVTMLCGCPIEPGGMWDADRIAVTAELVQDGEVVASETLRYAGETNVFAGEVVPPGAGRYELRVTAVDAGRANAGMVTREITVGPA